MKRSCGCKECSAYQRVVDEGSELPKSDRRWPYTCENEQTPPVTTLSDVKPLRPPEEVVGGGPTGCMTLSEFLMFIVGIIVGTLLTILLLR